MTAPERIRSCYLSPHQLKRLDLACIAIREAFPDYGPVLVGSVGVYRLPLPWLVWQPGYALASAGGE